jgi:hypothetical protein
MSNIRNTLSPLITRDIQEVEERFAFRFPTEVVNFYLQNNGGRPEKDRFIHEGEMFVVDSFLPIKYGNPSLTLEATLGRVKQLLPRHLIPIAVGPFGDFFCCSTRDDDVGSIYIHRLEHRFISTSGTKRLASSLDEFLRDLISKEAARKL